MKLELNSPAKKISAKATASLKGQDITAKAIFTEYDINGAKYVHLKLNVKANPEIIPSGKHAVHIHEKGDCKCEGFKCAGGHFDPGPYGNTDPDANHGYHAGDLPSIYIDKQGEGTLEALTTRVTLSKGPVSILYQDEPTSLMIHANDDPYTPGKSGSGHSGGARIACGTIRQIII